MRVYDILTKKKQGEELSDEEIRFLIRGYTAGEIPDYQMSAFTMAVCLRGMTDRETAVLTDAMAHSGETADLSRFGNLTADKHSTGGVGDKTTMITAPLAAALGCKVAKMTGRGLGHTGGTVDKLLSIPGFRIDPGEEEFLHQVEKTGIAVISAGKELAPADKKLYALRDVTATVDSVPLIASSIMSKKLAAGAHSIVLDVKVGSGGFMKTQKDAETLAHTMVKIGTLCGRRVTAVLTDMDVPLGHAIGNALEVKEAVTLLRGEDDGSLDDLRRVSVTLAGYMASSALSLSPEEGIRRAGEALADGRAYETFLSWIGAQGGDLRAIRDLSLLPASAETRTVYAAEDGFLTHMDTERIGLASVTLGAGRERAEDAIDPAAGIVLAKKTGDFVRRGDALCTLYSSSPKKLSAGEKEFLSALTFGEDPVEKNPAILGIVTE